VSDNDPVNHPSHYTGFSNGAEVIDIVENLTYNRGAAVKYLARAGKKAIADELEDLKKARWYIEREIDRLEPAPEVTDTDLRDSALITAAIKATEHLLSMWNDNATSTESFQHQPIPGYRLRVLVEREDAS